MLYKIRIKIMKKLLLLLLCVPLLGFTPNSSSTMNNSHNTAGDVWVLVISKGSGYYNQEWKTRSYFPKDGIEEGWDDGKSITSLTYGDGVWALVMSKGSEYHSQSWRTQSSFPEDKIKEGWDDGKSILFISSGY